MALILVICLVIGVWYVSYSRQKSKEKELISEGKAIERESDFWEKSETFTTNTTYEDIISEVKKTDFSGTKADVYTNVNGKKAVLWKSSNTWNAQLSYTGVKDNKHVYYFSFSGWKERNGGPYNPNSMNVMMTSVEKIFLALDPATTVETQRMQLKSKISII